MPKREAFAAERLCRRPASKRSCRPSPDEARIRSRCSPAISSCRIVDRWRAINTTLGVLVPGPDWRLPSEVPRP